MTLPDADILTTRVLNETRLLHPPTYIGARYLGDSLISDPLSRLTHDVILRKYPLQRSGRFHEFLRFKKVGVDGQHEYREFLIPSPWTGLAEAITLAAIGECPSFKKPSNVYSYIWPKHPRCPYNYEHYFNGYQARNGAIATHFASNRGDVAIVADIEKFYPNIGHDRLEPQFMRRLAGTALIPEMSATVRKLFGHLLGTFPMGRGIPTGPAFSPMLADISLSQVDEQLIAKYGDRYYRYVDDFVFVVPPARVDEAKSDLVRLLQAEGLTSNPDKEDVISSDRWLSHGPKVTAKVEEYSFEALVFKLKVFLTAHPESVGELKNALSTSGFSLPLGRMIINTRRVAFRKRLSYLLKRGWGVAWSAFLNTDTSSLVAYAREVRKRHVQRLGSLSAAKVPESGIQRRWHMQRLRYVTNRLLYLLPFSELSLIENAIKGFPEFLETMALLDLLIRRDIAPLLEKPGPGVGAASSLLDASGSAWEPVTLPNRLSRAGIQSASVFLLYGVTVLPADGVIGISSEDQELLSFCSGKPAQQRALGETRYIDELRTLQLNQPVADRKRLLSERYSESETSELEALDIGEDHFS